MMMRHTAQRHYTIELNNWRKIPSVTSGRLSFRTRQWRWK